MPSSDHDTRMIKLQSYINHGSDKNSHVRVYKQDKFSTTEEVVLHFLKQVNKDFHMDNYCKADWSFLQNKLLKISCHFIR